MLTLWGGALFPALTIIIGLVIVWTGAVFLILYALVWLARTIYTRRHPPSQTYANTRYGLLRLSDFAGACKMSDEEVEDMMKGLKEFWSRWKHPRE